MRDGFGDCTNRWFTTSGRVDHVCDLTDGHGGLCRCSCGETDEPFHCFNCGNDLPCGLHNDGSIAPLPEPSTPDPYLGATDQREGAKR